MTGRLVGAWALLLALPAAPLTAQRPGGVVFEWGAQSTTTVRADWTIGIVAGPRVAFRSIGGTRAAFSLGGGFLGDKASGRGEAAVELVLTPRAAGRAGVYLGGGLAGVVGGGHGGFLLVYAGLERSPGLPSGWAIEAGLGGGVRVRAAYHWRKFPRGWRPQK